MGYTQRASKQPSPYDTEAQTNMTPLRANVDDPFIRAHADGQRAVATFLPSLVPQPQPQPPVLPFQTPGPLKEAVRAMSLARHVEQRSARVARGLPPDPPPPPSPQETFGPELDPVHIRALTSAIEAHPETQRAPLIHEAHQQLTKWIAAQNGQVVIDGKMQIAHNPQSAETLAAKIINDAVDDHDQRKVDEQEAALASSSSSTSTDRARKSEPPKPNPQSAKSPQPSTASQPAEQPTSTDPVAQSSHQSAQSTPPVPGPVAAVPSASQASSPSPNPTTPENPVLELPDEESVPSGRAADGAVEAGGLAEPTSAGTTETAEPISGDSSADDRESDQGIDVVQPDVRGADSSTTELPQKGDTVTLKSGEQAEVKYSHPNSPKIRVKVDGKNRDIDPDEIALSPITKGQQLSTSADVSDEIASNG